MKEKISILAGIATILAAVFIIIVPEKIDTTQSIQPSSSIILKEVDSALSVSHVDSLSQKATVKIDSLESIPNLTVTNSNSNQNKNWVIFAWILVFSTVLVMGSSFLERIWLQIQTRRRKLNTSIILDKRVTTIDWFDKEQNLATYYEEAYFSKIGKLKNKLGSLYVDGVIRRDSLQGINCSFHPDPFNSKYVHIFYVNGGDSLNSVKSLFPRKETKFFVMKALLEGSFKEKEDSWTIDAINYCKFLEFKIRFPDGVQVLSAKFNDDKGTIIQNLQPIIRRDVTGRDNIILKIPDFDLKQNFVLSWKLG